MSWNYGRKFSIWKPFPSNPKNPKHTGFLGSACCFMFLCVPIPPVLNTFKKALSSTARPADWWTMLNQIDFEQNIVHSCYGSIQWWLSLISKLLNFCLHLGSRKATCTSGRQSKLKTSSATMVKRMLQVQWFSCTSKNAALEKNFRESTFDCFDSMIDSTDAPRPNIEACSSAPLLESSTIYWRVATWRMVEWTSWEGVDGLRQNVRSLHEDVKQSIMIQT